jgi:glycosyltransferase involved in cell wall biosynthesis
LSERPLTILTAAACPWPAPQGSQALIRETALALAARGHRVVLVAYGHGAEDGKADEGIELVRARAVPLHRRTEAGLSPMKPLADAAMVLALRRVLQREAVDVVHAHNYEGLAAALAARGRRKNPPLVYHAHNVMADELPWHVPRVVLAPARTFGRALDRRLPPRADAVAALHAPMQRYLEVMGCAPGRVHVVPPPVRAVEEEPLYGHTAPAVLYAGNLDRYQNLPLLRAAMEQLRRRLPEARLLVATAAKAPPWPGAERVPTPTLESLWKVLRDDVVAVCPRTSWSGYPIKVLNAMAAGRPAAACESSAHGIVDGETGLVVADDDAHELAQALGRLLSDATMRRAMGMRARNRVIQRHAPERVATLLEEISRGAAAGSLSTGGGP